MFSIRLPEATHSPHIIASSDGGVLANILKSGSPAAGKKKISLLFWLFCPPPDMDIYIKKNYTRKTYHLELTLLTGTINGDWNTQSQTTIVTNNATESC